MALHLGSADLFGDRQRLLCEPLGCSRGLLGVEALEHAGELPVGTMAHILLQIHTAGAHQGWVQPVKTRGGAGKPDQSISSGWVLPEAPIHTSTAPVLSAKCRALRDGKGGKQVHPWGDLEGKSTQKERRELGKD